MPDTSSAMHFQIDSWVVFQLGEQLVTDVVQAVVELVKNSAPDGFAVLAELIRVQVRREVAPVLEPPGKLMYNAAGEVVAVTSQATQTAEWLSLATREQELLHAVSPSWAWPLGLRYPGGHPVFRYGYRRGFVEWVGCAAADWEVRGDEILSYHPVRAVAFAQATPPAVVFVGDAFPTSPDGRVLRYRVGERVVEVPAAELIAVAPDENLGTVLSARWPRVPPGGWQLVRPVGGGSGEGFYPPGRYTITGRG